MDDFQVRYAALELAVTYLRGQEHPPQAIVEAAEQFVEFLLGDYEV